MRNCHKFKLLSQILKIKASLHETCVFIIDRHSLILFIRYLYDTGPLPDDKILDWSELKQNADDILKCI